MKKSSIFFLIFFILMTLAPVPIFYLFREQIGYMNTENKTASTFPELTPATYTSWPKRFEEWLSDTLPFKTQFIELYRGFQLHAGLDFVQSDVIRGSEAHLFYRTTVENYKGISRFTEDELKTIRDNLNGFFDRMSKSGTQCLLFIAPDKEQVYGEFMPDAVRRISTESLADQTVAYLRENLSYPVIYPKAELRELAQDAPVYFDTDTHWNELGGYFAAELIRSVFTGEPSEITLPEYRYTKEKGKDLAKMLGLSDQISEHSAVLIDYNDGITTKKIQTINHGQIQRFNSNAPEHKKLLILGDSFSEYCLRSAIHDVDEALFITYGQLSQIDWEAELPDYLVVMLVERNLPFLLNGFY